MVNRFVFIILLFVVVFPSGAQNLVVKGDLPDVLLETSGAELSIGGNLWIITNHGKPVLYQLDTNQLTVSKIVYLNNRIIDWEDLTKDNEGNFYIGDFGNNKNNRQDLVIYKISDPDSIKETVTTAEIIRFKLSDQKNFPPERKDYEFDFEAMIHYNGSLYLFSKSRGIPFKGLVKVYKLNDSPGEHTAELIGSTNIGTEAQMENWITGAAIDEIKKVLVLLSHNKIFIFRCFEGDDFFNGKYEMILLNHFSQKEAICFTKKPNVFFVTDEKSPFFLGGKLYKLAVNDDQINCN